MGVGGDGSSSHHPPWQVAVHRVKPTYGYQVGLYSREYGGAEKERRAEERRKAAQSRKAAQGDSGAAPADRRQAAGRGLSSGSATPLREGDAEPDASAGAYRRPSFYNEAAGKSSSSTAEPPEEEAEEADAACLVAPSESYEVHLARRDYSHESKAQRAERRRLGVEARRRGAAGVEAPASAEAPCPVDAGSGAHLEDDTAGVPLVGDDLPVVAQPSQAACPVDAGSGVPLEDATVGGPLLGDDVPDVAEALATGFAALRHDAGEDDPNAGVTGLSDDDQHTVETTPSLVKAISEFNGAEYGAEYLVLRCGDLLEELREDGGWMFGQHVTEAAVGPSKGWYPPAYVEHLSGGDA